MAELPTKLNLTLVTRERKILEKAVDEVVLPAVNGSIGVLPGHTPLLAELKVGEITFRDGADQGSVVMSWGFAEILPDRVIVIAEDALRSEDMDAESIEKWKKEQEADRASLASHDEGFALAEARIEEAVASIH